MVKATLQIKGENLLKILPQAVKEFQDDEYAIRYEMDSALLFMFEQKKRSVSNFAFNVILDFSIEGQTENEFTIQCYAMGHRDRGTIQLINIEKSTINDFRYHFFGYSERNKCGWEIGELVFL